MKKIILIVMFLSCQANAFDSKDLDNAAMAGSCATVSRLHKHQREIQTENSHAFVLSFIKIEATRLNISGVEYLKKCELIVTQYSRYIELASVGK